MCCKNRRDYGLRIPASEFDGASGTYTTNVDLQRGSYTLPFEVEGSWISAVQSRDADAITLRDVTSKGNAFAGVLPAVAGDLRIAMAGHEQLHITVEGTALASAPDLYLIFSSSNPPDCG